MGHTFLSCPLTSPLSLPRRIVSGPHRSSAKSRSKRDPERHLTHRNRQPRLCLNTPLSKQCLMRWLKHSPKVNASKLLGNMTLSKLTGGQAEIHTH